MDKLNFGTAGIPTITNGNTFDGNEDVKKLNLDAMELEFVHNVHISKEKAPEVRELSKKNNIILTTHAPYYINLNTSEAAKLKASKERILNSARISYLCNGYSVCFHPGYYLNEEKNKVYEKVKQQIKEIVNILKDEGNKIWIRPETTGKFTQFGDLDEAIKLSQEIEQVLPCVDFAHMHAKGGKFNTYDEFISILEKIEKELGKEAIKNMHIHVSGIDYGIKGEKKHLNLKDSDLNYKDLVKAWKDFNIKGVVISESPNIEGDALLLKDVYQKG